MLDTYWVPLGDKRAGMHAVAIAATISLSLIVLLGSWIAWLLYRYYSKPASERVDHETRAIKFLASSHGVLFLSLITGDLLQGIGFAMNYGWITRNALPSSLHPTPLCTAQAVFIQAGDLGSAFSSLVICINLFFVLVFKITPSMKWIWGILAVEWVGVAVMTFAGPLARRGAEVPFYGPAGGWCWMNTPYQRERLYLHYLWVFLVAFFDLLFYSIIAIYVAWQRRSLSQQQVNGPAKVWRIMMLFPLVYIVTILPLSIYRLAYMTGHKLPIHYALGAGFIFTLSGAANCCIYAFTRKIVSLDGIGGALRRGSGSGSFGKSIDKLSHLPRPSISFASSSHGRKDSLPPTFSSPFTLLNSARRKSSSATATSTTGALSGIRVEVETNVHGRSPSSFGDGAAQTGLFDSPPLTPLSPRFAGSGRLQSYQLRFDGALGGGREEEGTRKSVERPFARLARRESEDDQTLAKEDELLVEDLDEEDRRRRALSGASLGENLV